MINFFRRRSKIPKLSPAQKEHKAIRRMHGRADSTRNKAFDDYLSGRISKRQFNASVRKSRKIRRGF